MGTCALLGEAVAGAASIASENQLTPRQVGVAHMPELQQRILRRGICLPGIRQQFPPITCSATLTASHGNPNILLDGFHRPDAEGSHCWEGNPGDWITFSWEHSVRVTVLVLLFDSALDKGICISHMSPDNERTLSHMPPKMAKRFRVEIRIGQEWHLWKNVLENHQRRVEIALEQKVTALRVVLEDSWHAESSILYAAYVG